METALLEGQFHKEREIGVQNHGLLCVKQSSNLVCCLPLVEVTSRVWSVSRIHLICLLCVVVVGGE